MRTPIKEHAKIFYSQDSAESALVIAKLKAWKTDATSKETEKSEGKKEKQSWSEL